MQEADFSDHHSSDEEMKSNRPLPFYMAEQNDDVT